MLPYIHTSVFKHINLQAGGLGFHYNISQCNAETHYNKSAPVVQQIIQNMSSGFNVLGHTIRILTVTLEECENV